MKNMTFTDFLDSLNEEELEAYAKACSTTSNYLNGHLKHARKTPKKELMDNLWQKSNGALSRQDVLKHFYGDIEAA